ncbi:hypothetical protein CCICO_09765 [Corynebacterium ciconiae DSM 44920]|uniref:HNH endonuclease signature motif containing protein n=1 Tax=Corynebacterium ciconiae TaxID=227319 RepID=UPI000376E9FD|nr:HNH endonuclease signature motif containing protein [Corynebacterium ciconiae]WKD61952.1 hypothetical protein CCICO_09765 [Corynebacterium ciconiae DSM 44920]
MIDPQAFPFPDDHHYQGFFGYSSVKRRIHDESLRFCHERHWEPDSPLSSELTLSEFDPLAENARRIRFALHLFRQYEEQQEHYDAFCSYMAKRYSCTDGYILKHLDLAQALLRFPLIAAFLNLRPVFNEAHLWAFTYAVEAMQDEFTAEFEVRFLDRILPRVDRQALKGPYWLRSRIAEILRMIDPPAAETDQPDPQREEHEWVDLQHNPLTNTYTITANLNAHRGMLVAEAISAAARDGRTRADGFVGLILNSIDLDVVMHVYGDWFNKGAWTPTTGWLGDLATDEVLSWITHLQLLSDSEKPGYAPTEAQRHEVIARYGCCNHPGCPVPANRCEIDHIAEWHEGDLTATWNLQPLCKRHHNMKTLGEYTVTVDPQGTTTWRSKTGEISRSVAEGVSSKMRRVSLDNRMTRRKRVKRQKNERVMAATGTTPEDRNEPAPF